MPQNRYYFIKKRIKKTKISKFKSIILSFCLILVSLLFVLNASDLFSSIITNTGSLFSSKKIEVASYNIYAVSIADFDNQIQANQMAGQVVNMGGAGVVYNRGEYFVFTSSYPTLDCAQEVCQNLKDLGYKSKIITLNIDSISFEFKGKNSDAILECFQVFKKCYLDLYDLSVAFDKLQCDYTEVNSKILLKQKVISQIGLKLSTIAQELKINDICQTRLTNLSNLLNIAIKTANSNNNYTSNLKQVLIKLAILNQEFVKQVNSVK